MKTKFIRLCVITSFIAQQLLIPKINAEQQRTLQLNIDEVTRLALKNNFDIQVYRLDKIISEKELLKAQAVYDTTFDASYRYNEDRLKKTSVIFGNKVSTVTGDASITKELPSGTILSLGITHEREASDSSFATLNPYHESEASISITQPLGKNALGIINRNNIKITGLDVENSAYTSLDKIEGELAEVQRAYWNLLLSIKEIDLTEEILESAQSLYERYERNLDIGLVEGPEFYAAEANLKERQKDLLLARDKYNSALNQLRLKLNLEQDVILIPKDRFDSEQITDTFEDIIKTALENRRDYKSAKNTVKSKELYVEMKKNSLWPQIDLKGTLKRNGLEKKFSTSIREISSEEFPEYTAEVIFRFPLENRTARAEYSQKELEKARALVNLKKTECLILVQAHDGFVHAKSMYDSVELLRQAMELQQKKYLGEQERFERGRSDTDRLIRYQQDYLHASLEYLQTLYRYKEAIIGLRHTVSVLLQEERE